ncbi:predicted protein, partial [Nematostella vectensis]
KASAGDSLNNEIIKVSVESQGRYFEKLFNTVLAQGVFSKSWSKGYIVQLHKSGDKCDRGNYRGIAISSCLGKFFTLIINGRLTKFLKKYKILNRYQIGF